MKALGTYNFAGDIGKMTVPAAASLLLLVMSWRPALALLGALGLLAAAAVFLLMPRYQTSSHPAEKSPAGGRRVAHRFAFPVLLSIGMLDSALPAGERGSRSCRRSVRRLRPTPAPHRSHRHGMLRGRPAPGSRRRRSGRTTDRALRCPRPFPGGRRRFDCAGRRRCGRSATAGRRPPACRLRPARAAGRRRSRSRHRRPCGTRRARRRGATGFPRRSGPAPTSRPAPNPRRLHTPSGGTGGRHPAAVCGVAVGDVTVGDVAVADLAVGDMSAGDEAVGDVAAGRCARRAAAGAAVLVGATVQRAARVLQPLFQRLGDQPARAAPRPGAWPCRSARVSGIARRPAPAA